MTTNTSRKLFVNLPVRDLGRSMKFFGALGFRFNPQFTDERAACMIISDEAFAMLLTEEMFKGFAKKPLGDARAQTAGIYALSAQSRAEVDDLVKRAVAAGGSHAADPMDHGFMYGWSFFDPDGYHWEVIYMDPTHAPPH